MLKKGLMLFTAFTYLKGPGNHRFLLERTTINRLPYPYSNPSCVVEGSTEAMEKNLLIGKYTRMKCESSCELTHRWLKCGIVPYVYRKLFRDQVCYLVYHLNMLKIWSNFAKDSSSTIRSVQHWVDNCFAFMFVPNAQCV